ncbi:hypothetical protein N3K66_006597 [Trichothecium roseum]|uniref:Uncharacterized protein n=1 Tax=Trichothecium roseum TaxID=47278 RepID=A0ACC0UVS5_9HYPO|nr:hypothetical protein N3K66_006597 [Trichothecium roseum]
MEQSTQQPSILPKTGLTKSHEILTCTIKSPPYAYAQLQLTTSDPAAASPLDDLQVKSYCTAALRQFLGLTGAGVSVDVLKVENDECWVRVPRQDLGAFSAAITAWAGASEDGVVKLLRLKQCGEWLGVMVGSDRQDRIWDL